MSHRAPFPRTERGFTLLEVLVVIAVIGFLTGAVAPLAVQYVDLQRRGDTRAAIVTIHGALWGSREAPGFVADIGRLPNTLGELTARGTLPVGNTSTQASVRMGWTGSYIPLQFLAADALKDKWGTPYRYGTADGLLAGQIRSVGPDRTNGTGDDLTYPTDTYIAAGSLRVNLHVWHTGKFVYVTNPTYTADTTQVTTVTVYGASEGAQTSASLSTTAGASPPFLFTAHRGHHAVVASSTFKGASPALSTTVVPFVEGNARQTTIDVYLGGPGGP